MKRLDQLDTEDLTELYLDMRTLEAIDATAAKRESARRYAERLRAELERRGEL